MTEQAFLGHVLAQLLTPHVDPPGGLRVGYTGHEENHAALLRGDLHIYANYHIAPVARGDFLAAYPAVEPLVNRLAGRLDNRAMARLNHAMEFGGTSPADLARQFLASLN